MTYAQSKPLGEYAHLQKADRGLDKPFKCPDCGRRFKYVSRLSVHRQRDHRAVTG